MECLTSVLSAPGVDELVLVNHDNPEDTNRALRHLDKSEPKFRLIETGANLGFSRGCNIGAEAATGDLVLFLNPDAVLGRGVASRLKESANVMTDTPWLIGARVLNTDGTEQRGARRGELTPRSAIISFLGLQRIFPNLRGIHREEEMIPEALHTTPTVSGAAMLMDRRQFLDIGGFDERYFLHVEDIDICRTVRGKGGSVWFEPRAAILHYGGTSKSNPLRVETHKAQGFVKYFWKFYPGPVQRLATLFMIPPIFGAIWGRVAWLWVRGTAQQIFQRREAIGRLNRIRHQRDRHVTERVRKDVPTASDDIDAGRSKPDSRSTD